MADKAAPDRPATDPPAAADDRGESGVTLKPAEVSALGLVLTPAAAAAHAGRIQGYGLVVARETIVQPLTELVSARAAARQSRAAVARMQRLSGTAGADSAMARENAERQGVADDAAVTLAEAKVASALGSSVESTSGGPALLAAMNAGQKVVRVSFPLGVLRHGPPVDLNFDRFDGSPAGAAWRVTHIWPAPQDPTLPGRSFFATVAGSDLNEGERLLASVANADPAAARSGVSIPASALVVDGDRFWCYVERQPGTFGRVAVDVSSTAPGGYFIAAGIDPGDPVVTRGGGLLLARELNPSADHEP